MKKMLFVLLLLGIKAEAQELEIGVGGGFSINTTPSDNMVYKGDQSLMNYATNLKVLYTTKNNWQLGLEGHMVELASKSSKKYDGFYNGHLLIDSVGGDDKKLVYAKNTVMVCGVANKRFDFGGSHAFVGVAIGYVSARNNSHKYNANETYKGPDGGKGICYGLQVGYSANITEKIGIFAEVAWRSLSLSYEADAPQVFPYEDLKYSIMTFPVTFGIRYSLFKVPVSAYGTYNRDTRKYYENKKYNK